MSRTPPGPRSLLPGRLLRTLQRDPIPLFTRLARDYGDAVMFTVLRQKIVFFNHPDLIGELLVAQNRFFHKSHVLRRSKIVFGEGLLTSEDPLHLRQRRLAQPAFHRERLAHYAEAMVESAARMRERWRDGETLDIHHEMMRLTLEVVARTLFGAEVEGEADEIGAALTSLVDLFPLLMNPVAPLLQMLPIPSTRRLRRDIERLDRTIYAIIEERRASGVDRGDLLSMLLLAQDVEGDGGGMTDKQLRDEAMTLFLAGHETMANALAWTWYLLGLHPDVAGALRAHLDEILGDRLPAAADYPRLQFVEMVLAESMRLFPPAWAVSRLALQDVEIGEWLVPRGAVAVVAQAVMHRDARFWPDPERFDPTRFTAAAKATRPKFAYFPFGGGPRICIGEGFAWMEGVLLLATLAQRWRMELLSSDVEAQASITLRPRGGIRVRMRRRATVGVRSTTAAAPRLGP